tara:strand:+ start:4249 stop:5301 length:1053 start_codon:yes stop_codon:yes gene_type:complete
MNEITPEVRIEGVLADYIDGIYQNTGGLTAATLQFKLPKTYAGYKDLWNKEVTLHLREHDTTPIFRGYIKRLKENFNDVEVYAQDVLGYMVKGGNPEKAKIALTDKDNIDGMTAGNAITKSISKALLSTKVGTDIIGDTTPIVSSSRPPLRGTLSVLDIIKELVGRAVDNSGTVPRPNIAKVVDDGSTSQLVIELESDLDSAEVKHIFTEYDNIIDLKIVNKKVPTVVIVNGANGVKGTFSHDTAVEAYDRNYLEVTNESLKSPAECKDFAQKLFRANLTTQYEYGIETFEGAYLSENDVIRVETEDKKFSGNYRIRGKKISFSPSSFSIGLNINRKPPTLAEYIARQDN